MSLFEIHPVDGSGPSEIMIARDEAAVFRMVQQLKCREADVVRDNDYSFSVRLGDNGMWCIFHREDARHGNANERHG